MILETKVSRVSKDRFVNVLGPAPKPQHVWQKQFDHFDSKLVELAQMDWDHIPDEDLWYVHHDFAYMELQPDLFRHLFPACLKFWYETLMRDDSTETGDSEFHYGLIRGQILEKMLNEGERQSLYRLFCDGMLDRIEAESGFPCSQAQTQEHLIRRANCAGSWIWRFNTLGIVCPVIPEIWEPWWQIDHPGKAYSAVTYASGLIYGTEENPLFSAWEAAGRGAGGPFLAETDSRTYDWAWRQDNLTFLKQILSVDYVLAKLEQCATLLAETPESAMIRSVCQDAKLRQDIMEISIGDLQENLSRSQREKMGWD